MEKEFECAYCHEIKKEKLRIGKEGNICEECYRKYYLSIGSELPKTSNNKDDNRTKIINNINNNYSKDNYDYLDYDPDSFYSIQYYKDIDDMENYYYELSFLNYKEVCETLKVIHGKVPFNYFNDKECKNKNKNTTSRLYNEGLRIHHIYEYLYPNLTNRDVDQSLYPFEVHESRYLIYVDALEHFLLHILIIEKYKDTKKLRLNLSKMMDIVKSQVNLLNAYFWNIGYKGLNSKYKEFNPISNYRYVYVIYLKKFSKIIKNTIFNDYYEFLYKVNGKEILEIKYILNDE